MLAAMILLSTLAASPGNKSSAEDLLQMGNDALNRERPEEAIVFYERAYRLFPSARIFYNFARAHESAGRPRAALDAYDRFIAGLGAQDVHDREIQNKLSTSRKRIAELRRSLGFPPSSTALTSTGNFAAPRAPSLLGPSSPQGVHQVAAKDSRSNLKWWVGGFVVVAAGAVTTWVLMADRGKASKECPARYCL